MLISLSIVHSDISIIFLENVNFLGLFRHVQKKQKKKQKKKHDNVSTLANLSEIYEKLMYQQLYNYFDFLFFHETDMVFAKAKVPSFGALFNDLSKVFVCVDHSLLIIRLSWYWLTTKSVRVILSYLRNQTQSEKI